ncbi:alginate lyase family protein [Bacteroides sp.]|uniref:alginate lyase family protein n=1 Tax=Bacteroides sp. TaxID=29523 RepID=UPI0040257598
MIFNINKIAIAGVIFTAATLLSCQENKFGEVDLTLPDNTGKWEDVTAKYTYNHPCAMYNDDDFARVRNMLADGTAPQVVKTAFEALKASKYGVIDYTPNPVRLMKRGTSADVNDDADEDAAAAYQTAMLWKLTGDTRYADASVRILNAWADECEGFDPNGNANQMLTAGIQGYTFANAAEIMQTYTGWGESDKQAFKNWIVKNFAEKNRQFMDLHWSRQYMMCEDHYWSNWDLVNMCSYLSIGILTENDEMVNYVVNYFYDGGGNGCIKKLARGNHADPLGSGETLFQNQESGRDQGHSMMSTMVTANLCQIAYTLYKGNKSVPELDFFAAHDNAVLKMAEYVALCNLRSGDDDKNKAGSWLVNAGDMPFEEYKYCINCSCPDKSHGVVQSVVNLSEEVKNGRGEIRPGWEILYMHYAKEKGQGSGYKYCKMFADKLRPECGPDGTRYTSRGGTFDQLAWGTLMLYRE